jgi:hypothetical protein
MVEFVTSVLLMTNVMINSSREQMKIVISALVVAVLLIGTQSPFTAPSTISTFNFPRDWIMKVVLGAVPSVMATSDAYIDGYRQGVSDSIHPVIPPLIENPTGNQNITDFVNGYAQAMKDVQ